MGIRPEDPDFFCEARNYISPESEDPRKEVTYEKCSVRGGTGSNGACFTTLAPESLDECIFDSNGDREIMDKCYCDHATFWEETGECSIYNTYNAWLLPMSCKCEAPPFGLSSSVCSNMFATRFPNEQSIIDLISTCDLPNSDEYDFECMCNKSGGVRAMLAHHNPSPADLVRFPALDYVMCGLHSECNTPYYSETLMGQIGDENIRYVAGCPYSSGATYSAGLFFLLPTSIAACAVATFLV